ncbi:MAG: D-alanyl-D-alanine carboxypeptidase/D-alanyl-D-alanine-endopeptidase (penicillin-binding protein 4) [Myxococcota bacterium]|jgi:D-alanyl-D-alanine carboxypeptidase/D-alanyl-D-alanine-endopeptidase (penicillin-binding protein 4)
MEGRSDVHHSVFLAQIFNARSDESLTHPREMMLRLLLFFTLSLMTTTAVAQQPAEGDSPELEVYPLAELLDPLKEDRLFSSADIGIQVVNVATGEEVYAYRADENFLPASVMKVVTAAAALRSLGPAYRFTTAVLRDEEAEIDAEGTLVGNLYIWGGGDPQLVVEQIWKMARELKLAGVNKVDGDLVFDSEYFDDEYLIAGWNKKVDITNGPAYFAPISALTVNYNTTAIVVAPGPEAGEPARVELETPVDLFTLENTVTTGRLGSRPWMTIERDVNWKTGEITFTMEGNIPMGEEPWRYYRAVADPKTHFMDVFEEMMAAHGITVTGRSRLARAPTDTVALVSWKSPSLQDLLNQMNKNSSNIIAEQVLKAMGAEVHGAPGTTEKGLQVISDYLTSLGIPAEETSLVNGSGLSRQLTLRPSHITAVLMDMYHDRQVGAEFLASLSVGGQDGTLRRRFNDDEQAGRVRGKTGSVNGVYCLAGFIDAGDGEVYAFSFLVNNFSRSSRPVRRLQNRFGESLLELPAPEDSP